MIVGIGINTRLPEQGCPEELRNIAGSAFGKTLIPELRCRLTAAVLDRFMESYHDLNRRSWFEYRERSLILGKPVLILQADRTPEQAEAVGLGEDFSLLVRMQSGEIRSLNTGEVSIQPGEFS